MKPNCSLSRAWSALQAEMMRANINAETIAVAKAGFYAGAAVCQTTLQTMRATVCSIEMLDRLCTYSDLWNAEMDAYARTLAGDPACDFRRTQPEPAAGSRAAGTDCCAGSAAEPDCDRDR